MTKFPNVPLKEDNKTPDFHKMDETMSDKDLESFLITGDGKGPEFKKDVLQILIDRARDEGLSAGAFNNISLE